MDNSELEIQSEQPKATTDIPILKDKVPRKVVGKTSGWTKFFVFISLLASVAAAGGVGFFWLEQQRGQGDEEAALQRMSRDVAAIANTSAEKDRKIRALEDQLTRSQSEFKRRGDKLFARMQMLHDAVLKQQTQLKMVAKSDGSDWLLAEVRYLLRLANQRLLMGGDVDGAKAMLAGADSIVRGLDEPALFSVREAIAKDLAVMVAVEDIDQEGLFVRLSALAGMVDDLRPLSLAQPQEMEQRKAQRIIVNADDPLMARIKGHTLNVLMDMSDLIGIEYQNYSVKPLLPPEQHFYLKQNVRLMFEQAKSAVLNGQQEVYDSSLSTARAWLEAYFQMSGPAAKAVIVGVDELSHVKVVQPLPDISGSLAALKQYNARRHTSSTAAGKVDDKKAGVESMQPGPGKALPPPPPASDMQGEVNPANKPSESVEEAAATDAGGV